jgi:hypothetical protein
MAYDTIMPSKALLILDSKTILEDGRIIQRRIWQLARTEPSRPHGFKYSLYCGIEGVTIVRYDNETGKGDHKHMGRAELEIAYNFTCLAQLLLDFVADIERRSGEIK